MYPSAFRRLQTNAIGGVVPLVFLSFLAFTSIFYSYAAYSASALSTSALSEGNEHPNGPRPEQALHKASVSLKPYKAKYATTAMGMDMTLTRTLSEEDGRYTLLNEGEILVASLKEQAHFALVDGHIRGEDFTYQLKSLVSRRREVQFLPEEGKIRSLRKKKWTEHEWKPEILDRLSQQEQLRLDLMAHKGTVGTLTFYVVDGPKVSEKVLEFMGEEVLATALGELQTLHFRQVHDNPDKRSSDLWVAPDLDYAMVYTLHNEDGTKIEIKLLSLEFNEP